jgi:hypothetical protein
MKKLILLLNILIFSTGLGYAQQIAEKSNAIITTQPDSIGLREKVLKVLADKDYTVSSGKTAAIITTAVKTLKNGTRVTYSFQTKGADIIITGKISVAAQGAMIISYQGKKGTPIMNGWEEMDKIARAFGGKIRYEQK